MDFNGKIGEVRKFSAASKFLKCHILPKAPGGGALECQLIATAAMIAQRLLNKVSSISS